MCSQVQNAAARLPVDVPLEAQTAGDAAGAGEHAADAARGDRAVGGERGAAAAARRHRLLLPRVPPVSPVPDLGCGHVRVPVPLLPGRLRARRHDLHQRLRPRAGHELGLRDQVQPPRRQTAVPALPDRWVSTILQIILHSRYL